ncbi:MAG: DUF1349 domain-containing protein [Cyclobacteriaceae bacterium]|nr:DUF1349 domain-containing protein [Cyclobacteriaceae bacterium]
MMNNKPFQLIHAGRLNGRLQWNCEPASWEIDGDRLDVICDRETDFWQRTHYGFRADNGHFLYTDLDGDFMLETHVRCHFLHQYDQAGLMVRVSDECWMKTSVENELNEPRKLGAVVTNHGYSDWSTQDISDLITEYRLQIIRRGSDYKVSYFHEDSREWVQMRLFHLFDTPKVQAGIYACSPKEGGFKASFSYLKID